MSETRPISRTSLRTRPRQSARCFVFNTATDLMSWRPEVWLILRVATAETQDIASFEEDFSQGFTWDLRVMSSVASRATPHTYITCWISPHSSVTYHGRRRLRTAPC